MKHTTKLGKRLLSLLIALMMCMSMLPVSAFAAEGDPSEASVETAAEPTATDEVTAEPSAPSDETDSEPEGDPADKPPAEETPDEGGEPAEETASDEETPNDTPTEEAAEGDAPTEEVITDGTPADDATEDDTTTEEVITDGTPADDATEGGAPTEEIITDGTPADEATEGGAPTEELITDGTPADEAVAEVVPTEPETAAPSTDDSYIEEDEDDDEDDKPAEPEKVEESEPEASEPVIEPVSEPEPEPEPEPASESEPEPETVTENVPVTFSMRPMMAHVTDPPADPPAAPASEEQIAPQSETAPEGEKTSVVADMAKTVVRIAENVEKTIIKTWEQLVDFFKGKTGTTATATKKDEQGSETAETRNVLYAELDEKLEGDIVANASNLAIIDRPSNALELVLNLSGKRIIGDLQEKSLIQLKNGSLTIGDSVGTGVIEKTGKNHVIMMNGGNLNLEGGTIRANPTPGQNLRVITALGGNITLDGNTVIEGGSASGGGGIYAGGNTTLTMNGGTIQNNTSKNDGGGGVLFEGETFTMNGGVIKNNTGNGADGKTGGVRIAKKSKFEMNDGTISGNKNGGVVVDGTFDMKGGNITGNTKASYGAGVTVNGTFNMNGGTISQNHATGSGGNGGGVAVIGSGKFNLSGDGKITGNTADSMGGGVYVKGSSDPNKVSFTMSGGSIDNNTAINQNGANEWSGGGSSGGSGVMVNGGTFEMKNGTISANGTTGDGVVVKAAKTDKGDIGGAFQLGGGTIEGTNDNGGTDIRVDKNSTFNVNGEVTLNNVKVTSNSTGIQVNSGTLNLNNSSITSKGNGVVVNNNAVFNMTGSNIIAAVNGHGTGVIVNGGSTFEMKSGSTISGFNNGGVIVENGTFNMNGGTISNNTKTGNGAGVEVKSGSTFNMTAGTIAKNTAKANGTVTPSGESSGLGGGVYIVGIGTKDDNDNIINAEGKFTMSGGVIRDNTAYEGGGIYAQGIAKDAVGGEYDYRQPGHAKDNLRFEMKGGTVSGNTATSGEGGGIYIRGTEGLITGGIIEKNATTTGVGNSTENGGNGFADLGGGGIYIEHTGKLTLKNALIYDNVADGLGGGLASCINGNTVIFAGQGASILDNKANGNADAFTSNDKVDGYKWWKDNSNVKNSAGDIFTTGSAGNKGGAYVSGNGLLDIASKWEGWTGKGTDAEDSWVPVNEGNGTSFTAERFLSLTSHLSPKDRKRLIQYIEEQIEKQNSGDATAYGVIIRGNTSTRHGGGIANNGLLIIGEEKQNDLNLDLDVKKDLVFNDKNVELGVDNAFSFKVTLLGEDGNPKYKDETDENGDPVLDGNGEPVKTTISWTEGTDLDGFAKFDINKLLPFKQIEEDFASSNTSSKDYTFEVEELIPTGTDKDGNITYDTNKYKVTFTVKKDVTNTSETLGGITATLGTVTTYTVDKMVVDKFDDADKPVDVGYVKYDKRDGEISGTVKKFNDGIVGCIFENDKAYVNIEVDENGNIKNDSGQYLYDEAGKLITVTYVFVTQGADGKLKEEERTGFLPADAVFTAKPVFTNKIDKFEFDLSKVDPNLSSDNENPDKLIKKGSASFTLTDTKTKKIYGYRNPDKADKNASQTGWGWYYESELDLKKGDKTHIDTTDGKFVEDKIMLDCDGIYTLQEVNAPNGYNTDPITYVIADEKGFNELVKGQDSASVIGYFAALEALKKLNDTDYVDALKKLAEKANVENIDELLKNGKLEEAVKAKLEKFTESEDFQTSLKQQADKIDGSLKSYLNDESTDTKDYWKYLDKDTVQKYLDAKEKVKDYNDYFGIIGSLKGALTQDGLDQYLSKNNIDANEYNGKSLTERLIDCVNASTLDGSKKERFFELYEQCKTVSQDDVELANSNLKAWQEAYENLRNQALEAFAKAQYTEKFGTLIGNVNTAKENYNNIVNAEALKLGGFHYVSIYQSINDSYFGKNKVSGFSGTYGWLKRVFSNGEQIKDDALDDLKYMGKDSINLILGTPFANYAKIDEKVFAAPEVSASLGIDPIKAAFGEFELRATPTTPGPGPGPDPDPDPEPDPEPTPETPDEPTPMSELPEEEPPLAEMPDEETPLSEMPDEEVPLVELPEDPVPLANVPLTGDASMIWLYLTLLFAGSALIGLRKKEESEG